MRAGPAVNSQLTTIAMWALGAFLAAALAWGAWAQWKLGALHTQLGECGGAQQGLADSIDANEAALRQCRLRLSEAHQGIEAARQAELAAQEYYEREIAHITESAEVERRARDEHYRQDCAAWADEPVCPAVADSLRRAASGDQD